jgi:hypothetical protein
MIPMHWGTFELGTDTFDSPVKRLKKWWKSHKDQLVSEKLQILKFGGHFGLN